ncbi:Protein Dr1 [Tupaia chinensis]|uniref:Protein Dr1 n=1 Tax=Tupaia chinensis TaxID=246437 RepID=L9LFI9_TUPCH|nr:Protein Dr1 [Tupaia chinensis]
MASSSGNDDDLTIPRAAINKMIKETLPNVRVANDARELVVNCCTEFIHLISSEANEICNKSEKKTISPEHVIQGKSCVGFGLHENRGDSSRVIRVEAFVFLPRQDSSKQNWPNRNGFKCNKLHNKPNWLPPQLVLRIRQDLLRMKKMMMISEIHQLSFSFLYKCFSLPNKTVKEMLICNFVCILVDLPLVF